MEDDFQTLLRDGYDFVSIQHSEAILKYDMPEAVGEIVSIVRNFKCQIESIVAGGGGEFIGTKNLRKAFDKRGWRKRKFEVKKIVDGVETQSITHEIDHVKNFKNGCIALEIEWNNKDPFFDRDLENFKRLHADGAISIGCIVTRGLSLQEQMRSMIRRFTQGIGATSIDQLKKFGYKPTDRQRNRVLKSLEQGHGFVDAFTEAFVSDKYGEATTHWRKLEDRIRRGVGNPCPLILIGLPATVIRFDQSPLSNNSGSDEL